MTVIRQSSMISTSESPSGWFAKKSPHRWILQKFCGWFPQIDPRVSGSTTILAGSISYVCNH